LILIRDFGHPMGNPIAADWVRLSGRVCPPGMAERCMAERCMAERCMAERCAAER
jgi:hypothetical protein